MRMLLVLILLGGMFVAPAHAQGTRRTVWSGTVGERQVVVDERFTPPFTDLLVSVRVSAPGKTSTIEVSTSGSSPDLVVPSASDRLVLIAADLASIVDLNAALVVDQFQVARPSVSPNGRFIAYSRFKPRQANEEDVLLVYEVASGAQHNRLPSNAQGMDFLRNVGLPVFPEWYRTNQKYRGRTEAPDASIETLRSPIVWSSESDFVFLAGRGGPADSNASLAIHHVHLQGGTQRAALRSQSIDPRMVIDAAGNDNPRLATGVAPLQAREIRVLNCVGSACQVQIEWVPTEGLRAPALDVKF